MADLPLSSSSTMATLAKLTSQSTQTLSLLLERQRLQTLSGDGSSLHLPQITRNLQALRTGILALEEKEGNIEAVRLLKSQYERMRGMLGPDAEVAGVQRLDLAPPPSSSSVSPPDASTPRSFSKSPSPQPPLPHAASPFRDAVPDGPYAPYTDDPEAGPPPSTGDMLQTQRQLMDEQDLHLDNLSQSINRQHDLSLQINDELDVHTGLLQELDEELDTTGNRMSRARQKLDRVARGAKENSSTVMIGLIILVLLILIIIFKT